jgi:hypothetical protein
VPYNIPLPSQPNDLFENAIKNGVFDLSYTSLLIIALFASHKKPTGEFC